MNTSVQPLTERAIREFAEDWFRALDRHEELASVLPYLVEADLEMRFPETVCRGHRDFAEWYADVVHRFFDEEHRIVSVDARVDGDRAEVRVEVNWQTRTWDAPGHRSAWLGFDAVHSWVVVATEGGPRIKTYVVEQLAPMPEPAEQGASAREVIERYYALANAGRWEEWCALFGADAVIDEQLAGRIEGREALRAAMRGLPRAYAAFENRPLQILVDADRTRAAVVSHLSARTPEGAPVEAEVMNYFRIADGRIAYMANFHDTRPFPAPARSAG